MLQSAKRDRLISLVLLFLVGCGAVYVALQLGLWRTGSPGPGLFPFLASSGIVVMTAIGAVLLLFEGEAAETAEAIGSAGRLRVGIYIAALIGYGALLDMLGFYATTLLALFTILKIAEKLEWRIVLPVIAGALVFVYVLFERWLSIPFPAGSLWDLFTG